MLSLGTGGSGISILRKNEFKAHTHDAMIPVTANKAFLTEGRGAAF